MDRSETGASQPQDCYTVIAAARWFEGHFGSFTRLGAGDYPLSAGRDQHGVPQPGQPACMYHREEEQEDFLVRLGEALLLIEGDEQRLRLGLRRCPSGTDHAFVGAGTARVPSWRR